MTRDSVPDGREIYVMVVGEASRAPSWSLLGYPRQTTPMLERRDGVVPFGDMLTQCNATHKSVPVILSSVSAENYNDIFEQKSIITAFKEAGFATLYISNQVPNRSLIDYFSAEADQRVDISPREGQLYTDNRPDGDMLPILRQAVASTDSSLFVVLHMYGSITPSAIRRISPSSRPTMRRPSTARPRTRCATLMTTASAIPTMCSIRSFPYSTARMPLRPFSSAPIMART